jgi:hypothetical protein
MIAIPEDEYSFVLIREIIYLTSTSLDSINGVKRLRP